jgi:hypothetical protein
MPTIGDLFAASRTILNDQPSEAGPVRYADAELIQAFNQALIEARARRPDAFLGVGLRETVPFYTADDLDAMFPLDQMFYPLFIYYVVGWSELREDEFTNATAAIAYMNRFTTGLIMLSGPPAAAGAG